MKLAATRYDETNVDIHPFLILNMEKPKILQTINTQVNQFINFEFNQF